MSEYFTGSCPTCGQKWHPPAKQQGDMMEALKQCEAEIDAYIWQEYPADHPVHERYRQRDLAANPARIALAKFGEPET